MNDVVLEFSDSMEQMYIHLLLLVWPTGGASEPAVSVNRGSVGVSSTVIWNPGGAEQQAAQKVTRKKKKNSQGFTETTFFAKNEVKIWIQQMETQKTNDTVNKKKTSVVTDSCVCFSGYPQPAVDLRENSNQSPSGAALKHWTTTSTTAWPTAPPSDPLVQLSHTPSPSSSRLCFLFLFFAPTFPVIVIHYLFCCPSQISRSTTQLMAKVGICSCSSEVVSVAEIYLQFIYCSCLYMYSIF